MVWGGGQIILLGYLAQGYQKGGMCDTGTMIQETGADIMVSPTNPHVETAVEWMLEHNYYYGRNGWNGHCEPFYKNVRVQNYEVSSKSMLNLYIIPGIW